MSHNMADELSRHVLLESLNLIPKFSNFRLAHAYQSQPNSHYWVIAFYWIANTTPIIWLSEEHSSHGEEHINQINGLPHVESSGGRTIIISKHINQPEQNNQNKWIVAVASAMPFKKQLPKMCLPCLCHFRHSLSILELSQDLFGTSLIRLTTWNFTTTISEMRKRQRRADWVLSNSTMASRSVGQRAYCRALGDIKRTTPRRGRDLPIISCTLNREEKIHCRMLSPSCIFLQETKWLLTCQATKCRPFPDLWTLT